MAADITVRIFLKDPIMGVEDASLDFGLETFAGFLPNIGDTILDPGVLQGLDRSKLANRRFWKVVGRVFNPRDLPDYVGLIVTEIPTMEAEQAFVS